MLLPTGSPLSLSLLPLCFRTRQQPRLKHGHESNQAVLKTQPGSSCFKRTPVPQDSSQQPSPAHRMGAWGLGTWP